MIFDECQHFLHIVSRAVADALNSLQSYGGPSIYAHMDFLCRDNDGLANLLTPSSPRNQSDVIAIY